MESPGSKLRGKWRRDAQPAMAQLVEWLQPTSASEQKAALGTEAEQYRTMRRGEDGR